MKHDTRASAAKRGYDYEWNTRIRPAQLAREPLCRFCSEKGLVVAATVVDHIDGDSWNRKTENLRSLCKTCHDRRTARDQGFARSGAFYPKRLPRCKSPLTVVCGPPCAGKTTYINEHRQEGDFVIDWDNIAFAVAGTPMYAVRSDRIPQMVFFRNTLIEKLGEVETRMVWLEETGQKQHQRQHWARGLNGRVVVLETPPEVCIARVARIPARAGRPGALRAPEAWWDGYTVDYTDERIAG